MSRLARLLPVIMSARALNFPFSDTFSGGDGALSAPWSGATWTVSSGKAINTPVTLGSELVVNGDFTAWTGDNPDGWTLGQAETGGHYVTEDAGKCRYVCDAGQVLLLYQTILTIGRWYRGSVNVTARASGSAYIEEAGAGLFKSIYAATGIKTFEGLSLHGDFRFWSGTVAADWTIDDVSVKELTLSELIASVNTSVSNATVSVVPVVSTTAYYWGGLICKLDSATDPKNFIMAVVSSPYSSARLYKCVNGTYTQLINAGFVYSAGAVLQVVCSGSSVSLYYGGAQVGATQTVSDAGILNNTRHGLISTNPVTTFDSFSIA